MSLLFTHNWEHAVVAAVVQAAKKDCPDCYLGRTAIQKLVYFLHVLGVPMSFRFRIHHFGPYSETLASAVDWLQADSVITDAATSSNYSSYVVGENFDEVVSSHSDRLAKHASTIEAVVNAMASLDPKELEVAATLDYAFRWVKARGHIGPWRDETIKKFKEIKKEKFSNTKIEEWYESLMEAGLIQA